MRIYDRGWLVVRIAFAACFSVYTLIACNMPSGEEGNERATGNQNSASGSRGGASTGASPSGTSSPSNSRPPRSSTPSADDDDDDEADDDDDDDTSAASSGASGSKSSPGSGAAGRSGSGNGTRAPTGNSAITIQFKALVGGQDFACGEHYMKLGTKKSTVTPMDLRLFVQDVKLIRKDGSAVDVELEVREPWQSSKVALLDFEDGTGNCSEGNPAKNTKITGNVPEDDYVGISFSNAVPEELNHLDPTTTNDPLKAFGNLSWGWLGGFRFAKIELMEVGGTQRPFGNALLHVGATSCSGNQRAGSISCAKPNRNLIELDGFDPATDTIALDIAPIFADTDLTTAVECHATGDSCESMFRAIGLEFSTGKALEKQSVYRVQ